MVIGCASVQEPNTLFEAYSDYFSVTDRNNIISIADEFFSPELLGEHYKSDPDAAGQLLFKSYMHDVHSHFERIEDNAGCLVVNGYTPEQEPVVFSLKYSPGASGWLIDGIHVSFVDSSSDYPQSAVCPADYFG